MDFVTKCTEITYQYTDSISYIFVSKFLYFELTYLYFRDMMLKSGLKVFRQKWMVMGRQCQNASHHKKLGLHARDFQSSTVRYSPRGSRNRGEQETDSTATLNPANQSGYRNVINELTQHLGRENRVSSMAVNNTISPIPERKLPQSNIPTSESNYRKISSDLLRPSESIKNRITSPMYTEHNWDSETSANSATVIQEKYPQNAKEARDTDNRHMFPNDDTKNYRKTPRRQAEADERSLPWNREKHKIKLSIKQNLKNSPSIDYDGSPLEPPITGNRSYQEGDLLDMDSNWPIKGIQPKQKTSQQKFTEGPLQYNYGLAGIGKMAKNDYHR